MTDDQLIRQLIFNLAAGKIDAASALPVLRKLAEGDIALASLAELAALLESRTDFDSEQLKKQLYQARCKQAANVFNLRSAKAPVPDGLLRDLADLPADCPHGWAERKETVKLFLSAVPLLHDCLFIRAHQAIAPRIVTIVDTTFTSLLAALSGPPSLWAIHDPASIIEQFEPLAASGMPRLLTRLDAIKQSIKALNALWQQQAGQSAAAEDLDERTLLKACVDACNISASRAEKQPLIDKLCSWPTDLAAPAILHACREPWAQERAGLILSMRFAQPSASGWRGWSLWLDQANHGFKNVQAQSLAYPAELFYLWALSSPAELDPELAGMLEQFCRQQATPVDPEDFVERWAAELTETEANGLLGLSPRPVAVPAEVEAVAAAEEAPPDLSLPEEEIPAQVQTPEPEAAPPPPEPQKPTVWQEHIKPFISENWYMVVGLIMVLTGSSLLAYYTWDKSWILRYTIMPGLLALFTAALAEAGGWLERRDSTLKGTALLLRGAAIALLPVNFMTIALLSDDPQARYLPVLVPVMGLLYCGLFGFGLRRWCRDVHPGLKKVLGETLLGINCLALVRPLGAVSLGLKEQALGLILPAAFYLVFISVAAAVLAFTRTVVNRELAADRKIAWFFGSTLTFTLFEVFAWIHIWTRDMPVLHTYAPLIILGGGLVLMVERRILELRGSLLYSTESFLGFALLLLGLLLAMTDPYVRILSFCLAGCIWLYQGLPRKNSVDFWIALTLLALGGAAVGLVPRFPGHLLPALGIAMALCLDGISGLQASRRCPGLGKVCTDYQLVVLFITVIVAVLSQRHYGSAPLLTAGFLIFTAGCIIWRGFTDSRSRWVITGAVVLALSCAYLGCVDMSRMSLHGNTMAFGLAVLSLLWLAALRITRHPLLAGCRSSVLFMYGLISVAAMVVRVVLEGDTPADGLWYVHWMEYAGPVLMSAVLVFTACCTRSLLPSLMAAVILVILLPELQDNLKATFPLLAFGTGRASALSSLVLTLACFYLRKAAFLQKPAEGDGFFGESRFPLSRPDHTFLTWPLLGSVLFLLLKIDFYVLVRHLPHVPLATAGALCTTAIVWVLLAVYFRQYSYAVAGTHLGWFWLFAGLFFGHWATSDDPHWYWSALAGGMTLQVFYEICRSVLAPRHAWVEELLAKPVRDMLSHASLLLTAVCLLILAIDEAPADLIWLQIFIAAQLVWHSLARESLLHSSLLAGLVLLNILACTAPGTGLLMDRLSWELSLTPVIWFMLAVQALHMLLEQTPQLYGRIAALLRPFMYTATVLTLALGIIAMVEQFHDQRIILQQLLLLIVALCITARAHGSGAIVLLALLLGYVSVHYVDFYLIRELGYHWRVLMLPWKLSLFSLAMVLCAWLLSSLHKKLPRLLAGPFAVAALRSGLFTCIYPAAALFACLSTFLQTVDPAWRWAGVQLVAPYISALSLCLMGLSSARFAGFAFPCASVIASIGNVHLVRYYLSDYLLANGLGEPHLLSLGLGLTLLQATALRLAVRREAASIFLNRLCLIAGALVLGLLSMHYITDPNLSDISNTRFIVSGLMSLLAGWYFRNAARRPGPGEEQYVEACEAVFHYAVSAFIWCMALMLPAFKHPGLTLLAFWLPGLYFYLRAEFAALPETCGRYRRSAAVISFAILGLYFFKAAFNMIFYPELPINSQYYHYNSFYVMLLGLVLVRLHGLGGTGWLAFYGGLALMTGSYFAVSWLPGLSPFSFPEPAAWTALLAAQFWIAASSQRSPVKTAIQTIGAISAQDWLGLRRSWGRFLAVASHAALAWACVSRDTDPYMIAPLLLGGASILVHLGVVSKSTGYYVLAGLEVCAALHAGFLIPSYLHSGDVIWALLGLWAGLILLQRIFRKFAAELAGRLSAIFAGLVFLHVLYHHPDSVTGLWAFGLMGLLAAITPRASRIPQTAADTACAVALLIVPVWLAFFGTFAGSREPVPARLLIQALLAAHFTAYVTAALGKLFQLRGVDIYSPMLRRRPRVFDHLLVWLSSRGAELFSIVLFVASVAAMVMQVLHYGWKFSTAEMTLLCLLYSGLLPGWYFEGKEKQSMTAYIFVQLCAVFLFAAIRRQLLLTTDLWNLEYDVWASIAASLCITGAKQVLDLRPAHIRRPFSLTLLLLPAFAVYWVLVNGMGINMALVVVCLYSVMFSYLAKDDRESPYHFIAIGGFVSFVMIILWNKFQIRVLHAYTMPVGIGILTLVQLFSRRMQPGVRNMVRGIVLAGMFMSVGYAALLDDRYPALFNLTMIFLGIASMVFGTLLRLRLFLIVGAAGIIADLISIFSKMVLHMERTAQMTAIGMLILLLGVFLVIGTVYYKTHREEFNAIWEKWVGRLRQWE